MPLWISAWTDALRRGDARYADWPSSRHDDAAGYYEAMAARYTGGIRVDLIDLATAHRAAADRKRAAGGGARTLFGSAA